MNKEEQTNIIYQSVRKANQMSDSRKEIVRLSAIFADKRGVNVASAPYLHDIFCEALDETIALED